MLSWRVGAPRGTSVLWARLLLAIEGDEQVKSDPGVATAVAGMNLDAFEPFFRAHERDIFTYLWRMTGDEQTAYDLAQETFLRAWQHFARIRAYERPGGWLFRVATHLALNALRGRRTPLGAAVSLDRSSPEVPDPAPGVVASASVRQALMSLAPRARAALVLREVYGLSCDEVGATLGISTGAAKTLLWRARDEFRTRYQREEEAG